jgi:hypothetical protein
VDLGLAFVADSQPPEVVQVREATLDHPALTAQAGTVRDRAPGDEVLDVAGAQQAAVLVVVIAAVGQQQVGLLARPPHLAGDRPRVQVFKQRDQLRDVVAVAAAQRDGQRDPGRIDQKMVFGARAGTIDRGWPRQEPPKRART